MDEFGIDGIRIDTAEDMDLEFFRHLATACHQKRADFWMMGEVVFGNPRRRLEAGLNSVTNYQTYKSCWSSLNDGNMFELAYNLNQFFNNKDGTCKGARLQIFNENHDTNRIYIQLKKSKTISFSICCSIPCRECPLFITARNLVWKQLRAVATTGLRRLA